MQLRKQLWKKLRHKIPCSFCGSHDHRTKECDVRGRKGKRKQERSIKTFIHAPSL